MSKVLASRKGKNRKLCNLLDPRTCSRPVPGLYNCSTTCYNRNARCLCAWARSTRLLATEIANSVAEMYGWELWQRRFAHSSIRNVRESIQHTSGMEELLNKNYECNLKLASLHDWKGYFSLGESQGRQPAVTSECGLFFVSNYFY